MEPSAYIEYVAKYFPGLVLKVLRDAGLANNPDGTRNASRYLFLQLLQKQFSVDGKWSSVSMANKLVAADVVAMDSPLPLKTRGSLGRASGEIAKMGLEYQLNERQLTELDTLIAIGGSEAQIASYIFQDLRNAILAHYERLEIMFLRGLSTGVTVVDSDENTGTGVRLDYKFLDANKFTAAVAFSDPASRPFDQINDTIMAQARANGQRITTIYTDRDTITDIGSTDQAKNYFAFVNNFIGAQIPNLDPDQLNQAVQRRFGFRFQEVDYAATVQKDGVDRVINPWEPGMMTAVTTNRLGSYVYARLAEQNRPVAGVNYQTVDDFILVSQFRQNRPSLAEFLNSQARVAPVISGVEGIYLFDTIPGA